MTQMSITVRTGSRDSYMWLQVDSEHPLYLLCIVVMSWEADRSAVLKLN